MVKKGLLVIFLFLILISFVSSVKPDPAPLVINFNQGILIVTSPQQAIAQNQDYRLNFMTHNQTNGLQLTNDSIICRFVLENNDGTIQTAQFPLFNETGNFWTALITAGNFTRQNQYNWVVNCQDIDEYIGGITIGTFEVSNSGLEITESDSIVSIILILGAIFIFLLCLFASIFIPFSNSRSDLGKIISVNYLKYWKILFMSMTYITLLWVFNLLHVISVKMSLLVQFTNYFSIIFQVMNAIVWPIFVFIFVGTLFILWKDLALEKLLSRGINER